MLLPSAVFGHILTFADEHSLAAILHSVGDLYPACVREKTSALTAKITDLGNRRVSLISFMARLIADPFANGRDPPFGGEEALDKLGNWTRMLRTSRVRGERRERFVEKLSDLLESRADMDVPLLNISSPLDMLIALHFSRLDSILEVADYFKLTEQWLKNINRRAIYRVAAPLCASHSLARGAY